MHSAYSIEMLPKGRLERLGEQGHAVSPSLAVADQDLPTFEIGVLDPQTARIP